jgi:hypothetical protein
MCAIMLCASKLPCKEGRHLKVVLGIPIKESTNMVRRDFDTHEELHDILRRSEANNGPRAIEVAVAWNITGPRHGSLAYHVFNFYDWIGVMGGKQGERDLDITFRFFTTEYDGLSARENPLLDDDYPESGWQGKKWGCKVREGVGEKERMTWWEEGEK